METLRHHTLCFLFVLHLKNINMGQGIVAANFDEAPVFGLDFNFSKLL